MWRLDKVLQIKHGLLEKNPTPPLKEKKAGANKDSDTTNIKDNNTNTNVTATRASKRRLTIVTCAKRTPYNLLWDIKFCTFVTCFVSQMKISLSLKNITGIITSLKNKKMKKNKNKKIKNVYQKHFRFLLKTSLLHFHISTSIW